MKLHSYLVSQCVSSVSVRLLLVCALLATVAVLALRHDAQADPPPLVSSPRHLTNGTWRLTFSSVSNQTYQLLSSGNLNLPRSNWTPGGRVTATGTNAFIDDAGGKPALFYQVRQADLAAGDFTLSDSTRFVPVNGTGSAQQGSLLHPNADGSLPAFVFQPGGYSLAGLSQGLNLLFPNGAILTNLNGRQQIGFTNLALSFGPNFPFQLKSPLQYHGPLKFLPTGPLDLASVAALFNLGGLDVTLFGKFPLRLLGGALNDNGLTQPQLDLSAIGIPLPSPLGQYAGYVLDLSRGDKVRIPLYGTFKLPDGTPTPGTITIAPDRPIWLELRANGRVGITGRADVKFENGPACSVDFTFDDPTYQLQIVAGNIQIPLLSSLAGLLPPTPAVPNTSDPALLTAERQKLGCFDLALANFSAAAAGSLPASEGVMVAAPGQAGATATSVLGAWGFSSSCGINSPQSATPLKGSLTLAGQSAAAARDLQGVLAQWWSLLNLQQGVANGSLTADVDFQAEMTSALATASAAAIARAGSADAVQSLDNLLAVLGELTQILAAAQQTGVSIDDSLAAAIQGLMQRFTTDFTANLGVVPGNYSTLSPAIANLNHFAALDTIRQLIQVLTLAQQLGVDGQITAPIPETLGQCGLQLWATLQTQLNQAESAADYPGFSYALEDALEFIALRESGIFPNNAALSALPDASALPSLATRLSAVMSADGSGEGAQRSVDSQGKELMRLLQIIQQLPPSESYPPGAIQRAMARLESSLGNSFSNLNVGLPELQILLNAGITQSKLRDRFSLTTPVSWETNRLPLLLASIQAAAQQNQAWSELHETATNLLAEADRRLSLNDITFGKLYLQKASEVLATARGVALAVWQHAQNARIANPLLQVADLLLPGDIHLDRVAGSLRYDRMKHAVDGSFSGQMTLPKFNLALTVDRASFSSGGAFDLAGSGTIGLPDGSPEATLTIPARQPLKVSFRPPGQLTFASGANLSLANGMSFNGFVSLIDPVYSFGMSAQGIQFDLGTNSLSFIPATPNATSLEPDTAATLNEYYQALASSLESLSRLTNGLAPTPPGISADFVGTSLAQPGQALVIWSDGIMGDLANNVLRDYSATTNQIVEQLKQESATLRLRRDQLAPSEVSLRGVSLQRMKAAINAKTRKVIQQGGSAADVTTISGSAELRDFATAAGEAAASLTTRADSLVVGHRAEVLEALGAVAAGLQLAGYTNVMADLTSTGAVFVARSFTNAAMSLGLDPATGLPQSNPSVFANLTPELLGQNLTNFFATKSYFQKFGATEPPSEITARQTLCLRYRELLVTNLASLSVNNAADLAGIRENTLNLLGLYGAYESGMFSFPSTPIVQLDGSYAVSDGGIDHEVQPNYLGRFNDLASYVQSGGVSATIFFGSLPKKFREDPFGFQALSRSSAAADKSLVVPNSALARMLNTTFSNQWVAVESALTSPWRPERMGEGVVLLDQIVGLALWSQSSNPGVLPLLSNLVTTNLTVKMIGSATALTNTWQLNRYLQIALDSAGLKVNGEGNAFSNALMQAASASLSACATVINQLKPTLPGVRPPDLSLPGNVVVRRAAGSITYDRQARLLAGAFSGRLEFPDLNHAFFEISQATLDNSLNFSIAAATAGPLPLDGVNINASIHATGGVNKPLSLTGNGTLSVNGGPNLAVNVLFDQATHYLAFNSSASNLDLRFTDDVVLFNAGFGFTLQPTGQYGQLRVDGTAGFFARSPLGSNAYRTNFNLLVDGVSATVTYQPGIADLVFSNGTLRLPDLFSAGHCTNAPAGSGPNVSLTPQNPIQVHFLENSGNGQPSANFSGQVNFTNLGFVVPGFTNLSAELCSASLIFNNHDFPLFTNLNGSVSLPLPPSQTTQVGIQNGSWRVDGLPLGTIKLLNNITLVNKDDFTLTLLANDPLCTAGTALTVSQLPNGQYSFHLDGAVQVSLPVAAVSGLAGEHVTGKVCGGLTLGQDGSAQVSLADLAFAGSFRIGALSNATLQNAHLTVTGLDQLFSSSGSTPLSLTMSGTLNAPGGVTATLNNASFSFARQGNGTLLPQQLQASGQVSIPNGPNFSAAINYLARSQRLTFDSQASNLNLRLTDDFVIFDAGVGFTLDATNTAGTVRANGSAGMFAKGTLPATVTRTNFYLFADTLTAAMTVQTNQVDVLLSNGALHLPDLFSAGLCTNAPGGSGPSVSLTPQNPVQVHFLQNGGNGQASINFSGQVNFTNLGFVVPGFTNLSAELCNASLIFNHHDFPLFTNLNGSVSLPLPPSQTTQVGIQNGSWRVDGLPLGTIKLLNNVTLVNKDDFTLTLLANDPLCTAGTALTVSQLPNGQYSFHLDGAVQVSLPVAAVSGLAGEHVTGKVCGGLTLGQDGSAQLSLADLAFAGSFRIGALSNATLQNAHLTVAGLDQLFSSSGSTPLSITMSGTLNAPGGVTATLNNALFSFARQGNGALLPQQLQASGQVSIPNGPTFSAAIQYLASSQRLTFDSQASNLNLRLTDDFVIFDAGVGFTLDGTNTAGTVRANGSAGMFAKGSLPSTVTRTNFYLFVDTLTAAMTVQTNQVDVLLSNGALHLPDLFSAGLCTNAPGGSGPSVSLTPQNPVQVHFLQNGGNGQSSINFSGQVNFTNLGFVVPGFTNLSAELCSASLIFNHHDFPLFTNLNGSVSLPLPPSQTTQVGIQNASWRVDGLPLGTIKLLNNVTLVNKDDFTLTLLANDPLCTAGTALTVSQLPNGQYSFHLDGAVQVSLPVAAVSGLAGEHVTGKVCGGLTLGQDGSAQVSLADLAFAGSFRIGALSNATLQNAHLTVAGLDQLFSSSGSTPLSLTMSGTLNAPGGVTATLNNASFSFARQGNGTLLPQQLQASGQVSIPNGPTFTAAIQYLASSQRLTFDSQASNLNLRLTDDFVIFDAGVGFTLDGTATAGTVRANGSAGMFAKGTLPNTVTRTNFYLFVDTLRAAMTVQTNQVDVLLSNGALHLPDLFTAGLCTNTPGGSGPSVSLTPQNPVQVHFLQNGGNGQASLTFGGQINFTNLGFQVPDLPGLGAEFCSASLVISNRNACYFTNINGTASIPLPPGQTNRVNLLNATWKLDGYPSGTIALGTDLKLLDIGGTTFTLLPAGYSNCPAGSSLTLSPASGGTAPRFTLNGAVQLQLPASVITGATNDTVQAVVCGNLTGVPPGLPQLTITDFSLGGTFHLGGQNGLVVQGGLLSLDGLQNIFQLSSTHPLMAHLSGALQIPSGPTLILQNAAFTFSDPQSLPKFTVDGLGVDNTNFTLMNVLPAQLTKAVVTFKNPQANLPFLLAATNVELTLSASVRFPATGTPMLVGAVDNLMADIDASGLPRVRSIDAFEMGIGSLKLPPIRELGGRLRVGGLATLDPTKVYIVGRVGGSYNGYTVIGQFAANISGPLGFCLDVNAGSVGIPIGPTGILITGASGGESFVNNNGDPCAFTTYYTKDADGNILAPSGGGPVAGIGMSWENFQSVVNNMEAQAATIARNVPGLQNSGFGVANTNSPATNDATPLDLSSSSANLPCPGGCPPPTVDIFCQPHPDSALYPGKVIAKFSSIDEATLNHIGITQSRIDALGTNLAIIAGDTAHVLRAYIQAITPPPDPGLLGASAAAALGQVMTNTLDAIEVGFSNLCYSTLASPQVGDSIYTTIRKVAYAGLPCQDVTMTVAGNVSYAGISSVAYVSGKAVISTAGAAGVIGTVYVVGVPLGEAKVFVAATDAQGDPNPSICGQANVSFGPLDLGNLDISYQCPGCVTGVLKGLGAILAALSDTVLYDVAGKVAPNLVVNHPGRIQLITSLLALPTQQKLGIFAQLADQPLSALPANLPQVFFQGISNVWDTINPTLVACGSVQPKVFGIPVTGDAIGVKLFETKTELAGSFDFSPSYLLGCFIPVLPGSDRATLSFVTAFPDEYGLLFGGLAGGFAPANIAGYLQTSADYLLQNQAVAVAYDIHPFGFDLLSAAGRAILPDLTTHPSLPWSTWVRPENRGNTNLPSRSDLLIAAVAANALGDAVNWRGTTNDLYSIYPTGSPQRAALSGLSLSKDYFPHGGVLGAAQILLPALLTETPPLDKLNLLLNNQASPVARLTAGMDLVQNYVLRQTTNGQLSFYIPAPNPPLFYDSTGLLLGQTQLQSLSANLKPQDLLGIIKSFDPTTLRLGSIYPVEQAFLSGHLDGSLLGVPILQATVLGLPADTNRTTAFLSITSSVPAGSWVQQFIPQASLVFDLRGVPPQAISDRFATLAIQMQAALDTNATPANAATILDSAVRSLTNDLPRVQLAADLALTSGLHMPPIISDLIIFNGDAHLHAFSAQYDPTYQPTNTGPLATVQRQGGIAFQGSLALKVNTTTINVPNAELSVVPKASGAPALAGKFNLSQMSFPGFQVNNAIVNFNSDPNPAFSASGTVSSVALGFFGLQPLSGNSLSAGVSAARTGPGAASLSLSLSPARLALSSLYNDTILIHGATRQDPFTIATAGPWNASLEITNGLTLLNLVQLNTAGILGSIAFSGNGTNSGSFTATIGPGASVTLFPGNGTLGRTNIPLAGGLNGSLTVSSDNTFSLTASLGQGGLGFNGINVPGGASLAVNNSGVSFTWTVGGVQCTLTIDRNGTVTSSGSAELPPLDFGVFKLTGTNGGNLQGGYNDSGFAVNSGARLLLTDWLGNQGQAQSLTLNAFTFSNNNGGCLITGAANGNGLSLAGFPFKLNSFTFQRFPGANAAALLTVNGTVDPAGALTGFPPLAFTGTLASTGAVLTASSINTSFFGFPVQNFNASLNLAAGQYLGKFHTSFTLGNNQGNWTAVGANTFTGDLNTDGSFTLSADVSSLALPGFPLANVLFRCTRIPGQTTPAVTLEGDLAPAGLASIHLRGGLDTAGHLSLSANSSAATPLLPIPGFSGSLLLTNSGASLSGTLSQAPLPPIFLVGGITNDGTFSLTSAVSSVTVLGSSFNGATFVLQRTNAGSPVLILASGNLVVAQPFGNVFVAGSFNLDGSFSLASTISSSTSLAGAGLPAISSLSSAQFKWTQSGVSLTGTVNANSGGVMAKVPLPANFSAGATIGIGSPNTLQATISVQSITNGLFVLSPIGSGSFLATLDGNGLTLPSGIVFSYGNNFSVSLGIPSLTLAPDGSFVLSAGNPPLNFTWGGFSLNNVGFTLSRDSTGNLGLANFNGELNVPQLGRLAMLTNGVVNSSGTFTLTGFFGNGVDLSQLSPSLPIQNLGADATVTFSNSGLSATGTVKGGVLDHLGLTGFSASGTLAIPVPGQGPVTLSGGVKISPLTFGNFTLGPTSGSFFTATWNSNGLTLPAGLQLSFNNHALSSTLLPQIPLTTSGNFSITNTGVAVNLAGFSLTGASLVFQRQSGVASVSVSGGVLNVPGFSKFSASLAGTLHSDGTFSLNSSTVLNGPFQPDSPAAFASIKNVTSISLDSSSPSLSLGVSFQGGALSLLSGIAVSGTLKVDSVGTVTPSATIAIPSLALPNATTGFSLTPSIGSSINLTLNSSGLSFPSGLRLAFRGNSLGNFTLPQFAVGSSANFLISLPTVAISLNGFNLTGSGTLVHSNNVTTLNLQSGSAIVLPGLNTSASVSGAIHDDGSFSITGTSGSLTLPGLPVSALSSGNVTFSGANGTANLIVSGTVSGGILTWNTTSSIRLVNATANLGITSNGGLTLSGSVQAKPFSAGCFTIDGGSDNANITANWSNSYLTLSGARIKFTSVAGFSVPAIANLPPINIGSSGFFNLPIGPSNFSIHGFPFTGIAFNILRYDLDGQGTFDLELINLAGTLNVANLVQPFNGGSLFSNGVLDAFDWNGQLNLAGFVAADAYLFLDANTVGMGGTFDLKLGSRRFGHIGFAGTADTSGNFSLTTSGSWSLTNFVGLSAGNTLFNTDGSGSLTLSNTGISGHDNLNYGGLSIPISFSAWLPTSFSYSGTNSGGTGWFPGNPDIVKADWKVILASDSNGSFNANLSGSAYCNFSPISQVSVGLGGGIDQNGKTTVNFNAPVPNFGKPCIQFTLWPSPGASGVNCP